MRDEAIRLPMIGRILRRRRRLLVALAVFGAAVGVAAWLLLPATFASTSAVLVDGAQSPDDVQTEAQIATSRIVVDRAAIGLGLEAGTIPDDAVSAKVSDGNVIKITARSASPSGARALATGVTREYITFSTKISAQAVNAATAALSGRRTDLEQRIDKLDRAIAARPGSQGPPGATELDRLRTRRTELLQQLSDVEERLAETRAEAAVSRTNPRVIEQAGKASQVPPTPPQLIAGGALVAPLIGIIVLVALRLADRRLRRRSDIASALGAPVLGTVQAPADPASAPSELGGWRAPGRWLLRGDLPPAAPVDRSLEDLRCRRVLDRLRGRPDDQLRLLIVAPDDDALASDAVARLAIAAASGGRAVSVLTDDPRLASAVETGAAREPQPAHVEIGARLISNRVPATVLRVRTVAAARPTIPGSPDVSGVLVVVTSGTRTAWELLAVAEACHDAVLPVRGALVVVPSGTEEEEVEGEPPTAAPEMPAAPAGQLNGRAGGGRP